MKSNQPPNQLLNQLSIPKNEAYIINTINQVCLKRMNNKLHFQRITEYYFLLTIDAQNYFISIPVTNQDDNIRIIKLNVVASQIILKSTSKTNEIQFIFLDLYNHIKILSLELATDSSINKINQEIIEDCNIPDAFYQLISTQIFIDILLQSEILTLFTKNAIFSYHLVNETYQQQSLPSFDTKHKILQFKNKLLYVHNSQIYIKDQNQQIRTQIKEIKQESIKLVIKSQVQLLTQKSIFLNILTNKSFYQFQSINNDGQFFDLIEKIPYPYQSSIDTSTSCLQVKRIDNQRSLVSIAFLNQNKITILQTKIPTEKFDPSFQISEIEIDKDYNIGEILELSFLQNKLRLIHQIKTQILFKYYDYNAIS